MFRQNKTIRPLFFLLVFALPLLGGANSWADAFALKYKQIDSDVKLNSFVDSVENQPEMMQWSSHMGWDVFLSIIDNAITYCEETNNDKMKHRCMLYRHMVPNQYNKLEQFRVLAKLKLYPDLADSKHYLSLLITLRYMYGEFEQLDQFLPMIDLIRTHNNGFFSEHDLEMMKYNDLSAVYYRTKNYRKALKTYEEMGQIIENRQSLEESSRLNNMGLCYQNLGRYDSALFFFQKAHFALHSDIEGVLDSTFFYVVTANITDIKVERGNYKGAERVYTKQIEYADSHWTPHLILSSYLSLAKLAYLQDQPDRVLSYVDSLKYKFTKSGFVSYYIKGLKIKEDLLLEQGNRREAIRTHREYKHLEDSILSAKAANNYQAAAIRLEISEIEKGLKTANLDLGQAKKRSNFLLFGLIISLLIICFSIWIVIAVRKKNKLLALQKTDLNNSIKEREILLQEIHHRVKNNLHIVASLIRLKSAGIKDRDAQKIFKESQSYILSMSKVHQFLYESANLKNVHVGEYIKSIVNEMIRTVDHLHIESNVNSDQTSLSLDHALVLGILTSELVTNSMKYAFPSGNGNISLRLFKEKNKYHYTYTDSGEGFNFSEEELRKTFGLKLIRMSAEQLRGDLILETNGKFEVTISIALP